MAFAYTRENHAKLNKITRFTNESKDIIII